MLNMEVTRTGVLLLIFCFTTVSITAQVTFNPDPEGDVQLERYVLTPAVEVTTVQCYTTSPTFKVQYVTAGNYTVAYTINIYGIGDSEGYRVAESACGQNQNQYRVELEKLRFIADYLLVGGTFRLKATLDNNGENSTISRRTYTFPAPFNLTGSSVRPVLKSTFTLTCHVTTDYPYIEWIKDTISIVQVAIPYDNGSCLTYQENTALNYQYNCQKSDLTYTLTIPGSLMTEELQASVWRCKDVYSELRGSKFMKLDIIVPVTDVIITPGSGSIVTVDENQSVTLTCVTNDADPPPTIVWFLGSTDVTSQAGSNKTTLTLNVTRAQHQISVMCVAWNSGNTANQTYSTTLNVRFSAIFITEHYSQVIHLNRAASIGIQFYCNPPVTMSGIEWVNKTGLNDQLVESSERISMSVVDGDADVAIRDTHITYRGQIAYLNITPVQMYDRGYYLLKIQNSVSLVASRGITLELSMQPDSPTNLTVQCSGGVAHLSWSFSNPDGLGVSFQVFYKDEQEEKYNVIEKLDANVRYNNIFSTDIANIKPKSIYYFKVASKTVHGHSEYTEPKACAIFDDTFETSSTGPSVGGVAGGITCSFLVLIAVMAAVVVVRERRYRITKGSRSKENTGKYDDVQSPNTSDVQGTEIEQERDERQIRSTYEELQTSRDVHTYDHVDNRTPYQNFQFL